MNTDYFPTAADKTAGFVNLYLTVTPQLPCTNTVSDARHIQFDPCNGINTFEEATITVQPNPSNGLFTLVISGKKNADLSIEVFDLTGKMKFSERMNSGSGTMNKTIDLTACAKGIYILKCETDGILNIRKLIIQ